MHDGREPIFFDPHQIPLLPVEEAWFDGPVYEQAKDLARLTGQIRRVYQILLIGHWLTLEEIAERTRREENWRGDPEASISAQIRHLRKARFGGHTIAKRRRDRATSGLWEYRLES